MANWGNLLRGLGGALGGGNRGAMMSPNFGPGGGVNQQVPPTTPWGWEPGRALPGMRGAYTPEELVGTGSIPAPTNIPQARFPEPPPGDGFGGLLGQIGGVMGKVPTEVWTSLLAGGGEWAGMREQAGVEKDKTALQREIWLEEVERRKRQAEAIAGATPARWTGQTRR